MLIPERSVVPGDWLLRTKMLVVRLVLLLLLSLAACGPGAAEPEAVETAVPTEAVAAEDPTTERQAAYTIVDTDQAHCYADGNGIPCPLEGETFYGQDAQYGGAQPSYTDNGDGTVTDNVTGLMWQQDPGDKMTFDQAVATAESFSLAGYDDWRLPMIKELYSLILFSGVDPSGWNGTDTAGLEPFMDDVFSFEYGSPDAGERIIDSQFATSSKYVSTTMGGDDTDFGVNFADGRIKGYPTGPMPGQSSGKLFSVLYVRGNPKYGINDFVDNGNGTVTDKATGLTWTQDDSGTGLNWAGALGYCESLEHTGFDDWRLPNVKELQSIVDYGRSPDTTDSAAIDPVFNVSTITSEAGEADYPFYWSSTTHANMRSGGNGAYVSFGRAWGYMRGSWLDVHGAGAQRSDPKSGNPADWPTGHGPQGDAIRINNFARCVRGGVSGDILTGGEIDQFPAAGSMQPGGDVGQPGGPLGSPPQEAVDACSGAGVGDACEFTPPEGTITGTCLQVGDQVACVPEGGPPGGN